MMRKVAALAALTVCTPALAADIVAPRVDEAPTTPDDPVWKEAADTDIVLSAQMITPPTGGGTATKARVRALHDGEWLSIRVEWEDATENPSVGVDRFRDAAAVGFPTTAEPTSPFMGDEKHPVAIWQWSANHQANNDGKGTFAKDYPKTDGVWYADHDAAASVRVHAWRGVEPVEHFIASGFGTLEARPDSSLKGTGMYVEGGWSVVFQRKLDSSAEPTFTAGNATPMILAIWDGEGREVNGRKSVTMAWTPLKLEK